MSLSEHFSLATMKHKCSHQQEDQGKCFVTYHLRYYTFLKHEDIADLCSLVCVMTFSFSNFKLESTSLVLFPKDHTHVKCVHPLGYEIVCICMNTTSIIPLSLSSSLKKSQASSLSTMAINNLSVFTPLKEKYWLPLTTDFFSRTLVGEQGHGSMAVDNVIILVRWV